jgi:hypothetical protein
VAPENLSGALRQELERLQKRIQEFNSKKQAIENLLKVYSGRNASGLHLVSGVQKGVSTLEMAQQVLRKKGSEMKPEEIREAVRQQFGQEPAPTLSQMLYTRARRKKTFYRMPGGRFGLVEWQHRGRRQMRKAA